MRDLNKAKKVLEESQCSAEKTQKKMRQLESLTAEIYKLKGNYPLAVDSYKKGVRDCPFFTFLLTDM